MFLWLVVPSLVAVEAPPPVRASPYLHLQASPSIELWTDREHGSVVQRGDRVRVFFRTDQDGYVTVFRVDTDGRVRLLHPDAPWEDNFARARRSYEVDRRYGDFAFVIDDYPGEGYVFALVTLDPFDYSQVVRGDHWDYRAIATDGRIAGDPYRALQDIVSLIVPANYDTYGYDLFTYYVERRYDYPRFLCYDCHAYAAYSYWDPYRYSCSRFRIVIYDDPYYYPARVYAGTRVVYRTAQPIEPRFVFEDRSPGDAYVVRVRQRPSEPEGRRPDEPVSVPERGDRGVTGRDVGGRGTVPTPARLPQWRDPRREPVAVPRPAPERSRLLESPVETQPPRQATPERRTVPREPNPRLEPREPARAQPARPETSPPKAQPRSPEREPARQPSKPPERKPPEKPKESPRRPG
ncbi:MAG TPA: DUF4384 domain-containing protein [Gemmatimonadales bacterium]|nr:DUF4384 domain-containing protein [Gemmatimonadales bacterium]